MSDYAVRRYVILRHEGIADPHFDIMLEEEIGGTLITFQSRRWPITGPTSLVKLDNHRHEYLTYEGPVSGNRGHVRRVESGTYRSRTRQDDPCVMEWVLNGPVRAHLTLLCPPTYAWTLEPAESA
jgi:hypothetical protein